MKHIPYIAPSGEGKAKRPGCSCGWFPLGNYSKSLAQDLAIRHAYHANLVEEIGNEDE